MAIHVRCSCGQLIAAQETDAGKKARCPACGAEFTIPHGDTYPVPEQAPGYGAEERDTFRSRQLARQAKVGVWCGIIAVFLFVMIFVVSLSIAGGGGDFKDGLKRGYEAGQDKPATAFATLGCWGGSTICSILAIVFGSLGRRRGNVHNRGVGTTGMVLGIIMTSLNCCFGILTVIAAMALLGGAQLR